MCREYEVWFNIYRIRPAGGEAIRVIAKENHIYGLDVHPEDNLILHRYPAAQKAGHHVFDTQSKFDQATKLLNWFNLFKSVEFRLKS